MVIPDGVYTVEIGEHIYGVMAIDEESDAALLYNELQTDFLVDENLTFTCNKFSFDVDAVVDQGAVVGTCKGGNQSFPSDGKSFLAFRFF